MATKPPHYPPESKLAFLASARPANWRWSEDTQPEKLSKVSDYIDLSDEMVTPTFDFISQVLAKSGHIQEKDRKKIIKRLEKLGPEGKLYLDGLTVSCRIKTLKACEDKILKDNKDPDEIGDYIGIKMTGKSKEDVVRLRSAVLSMSNLTSSKCEITYPSAEYYVSHKSHHRIENKNRRLAVEAIITHADFEIIDQMTHPIMEEERELLRKIASTSPLETQIISGLKDKLARKVYERSEWNYHTLVYSGLHELSAPDAPIRKRLREDSKPDPHKQDYNDEHRNMAHRIVSTIALAFVGEASQGDNDDHRRTEAVTPQFLHP